MSAASRVGEWLYAKMSGYPREWTDPDRLAGWQAAHADPNGDVWYVDAPTGDGWRLYPPGSVRPDQEFPYEGVEPVAATMDHTVDGCCDDQNLWLADVEHWLRPWIEAVSGGRVVGMIEGVARYGPNNALSEYAIYARVTR